MPESCPFRPQRYIYNRPKQFVLLKDRPNSLIVNRMNCYVGDVPFDFSYIVVTYRICVCYKENVGFLKKHTKKIRAHASHLTWQSQTTDTRVNYY